MNHQRVKEIIEKIKSSKIAVYGDFCLDAYWMMDPRGSEVSVETGIKAEAVASHYPFTWIVRSILECMAVIQYDAEMEEN